MDIRSLAEYAGSMEAIISAVVVVVGAIFSPRLWRMLRRTGSAIKGAATGLTLIAELHPTIAELPARLSNLETSLAETRTSNDEARGKLDELMQQVQRIDHQVHPNGGASLNDMIKGVAQEVAGMRGGLHILTNVMRISWDAVGHFGIFYADPTGEHTYCSAAYLKWVNRTDSEMRGKGWLNALHRDDRQGVSREWESCVRDERDFDMRYRLTRDGESFMVKTQASPIRDSKDVVVMWVGIIRRDAERRVS